MKTFRAGIYTLTLFFGLVACQANPPAAPSSAVAETAPPTVQVTAAMEAPPQANATSVEAAPPPTDALAPVATATVPQGIVAPTAPSVEEADSPTPEGQNSADDMLTVTELPVVGTPGRYVNIAFGYVVHYPETWFTGFGNRPMLTSFSDLDPGVTNRESMRATGCLIEIAVAANVYGFTLQTLLAQMPQTYEGAENFQLGGEDAVRIIRDNENVPYKTETVQVVHDGRLFTIVADMARTAEESCRPVWENLLNHWIWFTPDLTPYRNIEYGYSISYPQAWSIIESSDQSVVMVSQAPAGIPVDGIARDGMVVKTSVVENPELLPLKQWLAANVSELGLTNDIELDTLRGVRSVKASDEDIQKMIGYFQGPLGKIYIVETSYPIDRQREFRPYANAIIYSFGF